MKKVLGQLILLVFLVFSVIVVEAKVVEPRYPDFFEQHLRQSKYSIDTAAAAVVLYETTEYSIIENTTQYLTRKRVRKVIKILTESGKKYADIHDNAYYDKEEATNFRALSGVTYNLQNEMMTEDKLDKGSVVSEVANSRRIYLKFSMPAVRAGSVIDYEYTIDEPLLYCFGRSFFREEIPKLYCEVSLRNNAVFGITALLHSGIDFKAVEKNRKEGDPSLFNAYTVNDVGLDNNVLAKWVVMNIPACTPEPLVTNILNSLDRISFQIATRSSLSGAGTRVDDVFNDWKSVDKYYLDNEHLLKKIRPHASYVKDILAMLPVTDTSQLQKAQSIYGFVRDSFSLAPARSVNESLEHVVERRGGSQKDLNLLFISLLKGAGIRCSAVLLSTTESIRLTPVYPIIDFIDHIATAVTVEGQTYLADPTGRYMPFGVLSPKCYNGYVRVVDADSSYGFDLNADQLVEKERCVVYTVNNDPNDYVLNIRHYYGDVVGPGLRKNIIRDTNNVRKTIMKEIPPYAELLQCQAENLNDINDRLVLQYSIKVPWKGASVYMPLCMVNYFSSDPLTAARRELPIEFPCAVQMVYDINFQVPEGYKLMDTVHTAQHSFKMNNRYRYIASYIDSSNTIRLNTTFSLKDTYFESTDNELLGVFFDKMIELQQTPYYFKKI